MVADRTRLLGLGFGAVLAASAAQAGAPPEWSRPVKPFPIVGPVYYVGTEGIGVYVIRTDAGLILLDAGLDKSVPDVESNIRTLGFRPNQIKLILATHAHYDHAEGLARLKRDSGALFASSAGDRRAYETGTPPSDLDYGVVRFPPVKVDRPVIDGRPITLGGVTMTPILTPGHTPGCTSWTMRVTDRGRPLTVVFPCSITVAGNKLIGNRGYPGIVPDFRRSFARLATVRADVVLPAHPELADVLGRAKRRDAGDKDAFIAPKLLPQLVGKARTDFETVLKAEQGR